VLQSQGMQMQDVAASTIHLLFYRTFCLSTLACTHETLPVTTIAVDAKSYRNNDNVMYAAQGPPERQCKASDYAS
jgi:hypothetical protein